MPALSESLADAAYKTVSVLKDVSIELQTASTLQEASDVLLRDDRKMYVGIALILLAVILLLLRAE
jgi:hypothetical protein